MYWETVPAAMGITNWSKGAPGLGSLAAGRIEPYPEPALTSSAGWNNAM